MQIGKPFNLNFRALFTPVNNCLIFKLLTLLLFMLKMKDFISSNTDFCKFLYSFIVYLNLKSQSPAFFRNVTWRQVNKLPHIVDTMQILVYLFATSPQDRERDFVCVKCQE